MNKNKNLYEYKKFLFQSARCLFIFQNRMKENEKVYITFVSFYAYFESILFVDKILSIRSLVL